ncbi:MAG: DNA recombination protein RmuC, partial [Planctomycetes bacterium]|nr:DNA recombination protein RmuC [Planctomycetota bacterium]
MRRAPVTDNARRTGAALEATYRFLLWLLPTVEKFPRSQERVEFAIRLPGRDSSSEVLLPIDSKFPQEDYEKLLHAAEAGDAAAVAEAGRALEDRVRGFARTIREKYVTSPRTTDFAILFLPTE